MKYLSLLKVKLHNLIRWFSKHKMFLLGFISLLFTIFGYYYENADRFPWMMKIVAKNYYNANAYYSLLDEETRCISDKNDFERLNNFIKASWEHFFSDGYIVYNYPNAGSVKHRISSVVIEDICVGPSGLKLGSLPGGGGGDKNIRVHTNYGTLDVPDSLFIDYVKHLREESYSKWGVVIFWVGIVGTALSILFFNRNKNDLMRDNEG